MLKGSGYREASSLRTRRASAASATRRRATGRSTRPHATRACRTTANFRSPSGMRSAAPPARRKRRGKCVRAARGAGRDDGAACGRTHPSATTVTPAATARPRGRGVHADNVAEPCADRADSAPVPRPRGPAARLPSIVVRCAMLRCEWMRKRACSSDTSEGQVSVIVSRRIQRAARAALPRSIQAPIVRAAQRRAGAASHGASSGTCFAIRSSRAIATPRLAS